MPLRQQHLMLGSFPQGSERLGVVTIWPRFPTQVPPRLTLLPVKAAAWCRESGGESEEWRMQDSLNPKQTPGPSSTWKLF